MIFMTIFLNTLFVLKISASTTDWWHNQPNIEKLLEDFKREKAELKKYDQELELHYRYVRANCTNVLKKTFNRACKEAINQIVVSIPQKKQESVQKMLYALNDYIGNVRDKEDRRQVGWKGMYQKLREAAEKVYEYYDEFYDITSDDIESGRIYRYAKCEMSFWKRLMGRCASTH